MLVINRRRPIRDLLRRRDLNARQTRRFIRAALVNDVITRARCNVKRASYRLLARKELKGKIASADAAPSGNDANFYNAGTCTTKYSCNVNVCKLCDTHPFEHTHTA